MSPADLPQPFCGEDRVGAIDSADLPQLRCGEDRVGAINTADLPQPFGRSGRAVVWRGQLRRNVACGEDRVGA